MKQIRGYRPIKDSERFRVRYVLPSHRFHKRLVNRGQLLDKIFILSNGIWNERFFETSKFLLWDKKITRFFVRIHFKKFWHSIRSSETRDPHSSVHHRLKPCKKTGNAGHSLNSEFSMAVRNSAGSRIRWTCMRRVRSVGKLAHVAEFFHSCNNACDAVSRALVRALRV